MALPKLMHPTFELTVPSTKKTCKFRPFLVKEEKLLLMAKQSGEQIDIVNVLKQVINNCDVESVVDVSQLSSFDIEYLFLKLRAKSINNMIELSYTDYEDDQNYKFTVNVDDVEIQYNEEHNNIIKLTIRQILIQRSQAQEIQGKI
jgi:hypothetical protein